MSASKEYKPGFQFALFLCSLLLSLQVNAADAILDFLTSSQNDLSSSFNSISLTSIQELPWFDEPEARIGTGRESGAGPSQRQNSYSVRMKPILGAQRAAQRRLQNLSNEQRQIQEDAALNDVLLRRYIELIDMLALQIDIEYLTEEVQLSQLNVEIDQSLVQTTDFNPERLQDLELQQFQLQQQLQLQSTYLNASLRDSGAPGEMATLLEARADWLITPDELIEEASPNSMISTYSMTQETAENLQVRNSQLALQMEEQELVRERAEKYPPIKFVELKYTDRDARGGNEAETTLSFSIPFGRRKQGFFEEERDIADARTDLLIDRRDALLILNERRSSLRLMIEQSTSLESLLVYIDEKLQQSLSSGNPRLLISLQEERIDAQRQLTQLQTRAMRDYVEILHTSGRLVAPPLKNWLQSSP